MAKVMLVTGGSRGIGAAVCRLAGTRGYDVAVNYAGSAAAAEAVAGDVRKAGGRAITIQADVGDDAAVSRMFERVDAELGPLEVFVNNAGIISRSAQLADYEASAIRRVIEIDLVSAIICASLAAKRMAKSRGGKGGVIVNMSSMAVPLAGAGGFIPYGAAKGGIDVLTTGLGKEMAGDGIRVCGVRPGLIATELHDETGVENRIARFGPTVPIGRAGTPEEVAAAVLWLASDEASYVTATTFDIAGGR